MPAGPKDGESRNDDASGDRGIGGHVQKRAANIEIAFASGHKHQRGCGVDSDAEKRNPNHGARGDVSRSIEAAYRFPCDRADRYEQENCIKQRGQN